MSINVNDCEMNNVTTLRSFGYAQGYVGQAVSNSWLVIDVASLSVPEKLLALLPLAVFMPRVIRKWRERKRVKSLK